jgi:chromosome segregation ATPase
MISLEQVRALEARVEKAVAYIASLRAENASLKDGLLEAELRTEAAEARTAELEGLIKEFQKDQERIEEGIVQALRKLDSFEDAVHAAAKPPLAPVPAAATDAKAAAGSGVESRSNQETKADQDGDALIINASAEEGPSASEPGSDQSDGLDIF